VVGSIVYFSNLGAKDTIGLSARTGHQVFGFPDGAFNPVVCDDGTVYLTGYTKLYQLIPKRRLSAPPPVPAGKIPRNRGQSRSGRRSK
jgi:hypothetical protein